MSSTNHDSGTGMMSPNMGGNLLCMNTSFSSCIRDRNAVEDLKSTNYTQGDRLNNVPAGVTSVTYTLCTFNEMTDSSPSEGGAAIYLFVNKISLTIKMCSFHKCHCTGNGNRGGAVRYSGPANKTSPVSISDSSFTECYSFYSTGSLDVMQASTITMTGCCFAQSTSPDDGAVRIDAKVMTLSNNAFLDCTSQSWAGALHVWVVKTLSLSFSQFRACSANVSLRANDIVFNCNKSTEITQSMVKSCDSTSGPPNVFFGQDLKNNSILVPQLSLTTTIKSLDVTFGVNEATVSVETEEAIKGTMNVLLDGSNVPRLVHVVFGSGTTSSKLGKAVVTSGPNGILPEADYSFRNATVTGSDIITSFPPFIIEASSSLNDWNTTEIVLRGANFKDGWYSMLVGKEGNEWNIPLTWSDSGTLNGTAPLHPSTAAERLEWLTEYEVTRVMWMPPDGQTEEEVALSNTITFTTPDAPIRITSASCSLGGQQQKSALVTLTGVKLGGGKSFNVTVRKMERSTPVEAEIVLSGTLSGDSSSTEHTHSVVIFGNPDSLLSFGTTFLITSFDVDGAISVVDADETFSVPAEPARIEDARCWLNGKKDVLIVELSGSALSSSGQTVVMSGSSGNVSSNGVIFNVTSSKCLVNFSIGLSASSSAVVFGGRYDLLSVGSGSSSFIVTTGLFIEVPHPPRITSITTPTEIDSSSFVLSVSGSNLPSGETFTVTLTSGYPFDIMFSSANTGESTIMIGRSGNVEYNKTYKIQSIIQAESSMDDEHILFTSTAFRTPLGPTLSSISSAFSSSSPNFLNLTLTTQRMPSNDFTLTLKSSQSPMEPVRLLVTSSDLSTGFVLVEVYNQTDTLKYGTEYSVVGMTSSSVVAVVSAVPFSTPDAPIRITSASCSLGGDQQKSALVTLTGVKFGGGKDYNLTVRKMEGSMPVGDEIVLSGTLSGAPSSTSHTHSVLIYGPANPLLSFGTRYLITQFHVDGSISVVDSNMTFSVPAEPARIEKARCWLNGKKDVLIVELSGSALSPSGQTVVMSGSLCSDLIQPSYEE
ncbi:hypothetical protein BLNAU_19336 [Blattamonas nauphoetae]|uniref:Uncharacterized protein n=1 Tax=Blattamonas nauphoetae TaxID=2049346 RepID=A0ABQ9X288_9EUKA|nr:hypothetical protein BLNAU_19336 [Blattamonas nauphoetae]